MKRRQLRAEIESVPAGRRILQALEIARTGGWSIVAGDPFIDADERTCCPLNALHLDAGHGGDFQDAAETVLGWSYSKAWAFALGFDGENERAPYDEEQAWKYQATIRLGRMFRRLLEMC